MGWSPFRKTGLTYHQPAASVKGYTLITPIGGDSTYLIDMSGLIVHRWHITDLRVFYARLLPNGRLLAMGTHVSTPPANVQPGDVPPFDHNIRRIGGNATHLYELDWDGAVEWTYSNPSIHHDFVRLENGNTIMPVFVELPADVARDVRGGYRDREKTPPLVSDEFLEVSLEGKEVRRIELWKLLDPRRDPICALERRLEWTHTNSLDATSSGDILFSCRVNSRVGLIDGKSGQLKWKYGAPNLYHQHHASALLDGNVQVFDNGMHRVGNPRSRVVEINPRDDNVAWQYVENPEARFFSAHISGAERLPAGNVLICEGAVGRVFEVTRTGQIVWEWISPFSHPSPVGQMNSWIFRAHRLFPEHSALAGRDLDPSHWRALNRLYGLVD